MQLPYINIHTHRPTGHGIELRTAGVHPWDAERQATDQLEALLGEVDAVGEIGLDFACNTDKKMQYTAFKAQLRLAQEHNLPVVLHCVRAFGEVLRELAACAPRAVIFHGFIGSAEQVKQAVDSGYYLSFGARTFASPRTLAALREVPLTHLFFETDDSDMPIEEIYAQAAQATGRTVEELQRATRDNYELIFGEILNKTNG